MLCSATGRKRSLNTCTIGKNTFLPSVTCSHTVAVSLPHSQQMAHQRCACYCTSNEVINITPNSSTTTNWQHAKHLTEMEQLPQSRGQLKCDDTRTENRFCLSAKWTSPFKSVGASVQLTTGSRVVCIGGSNAGHTMF